MQIEGPKKIGMPSPRLVDQKSHNATSSANAGPTKLIVHANRVIRPEVFNRNPKMGVRHRLRWRAEEKKALLDGLAKYGMGQWAKIVKDSTFGGIVRYTILSSYAHAFLHFAIIYGAIFTCVLSQLFFLLHECVDRLSFTRNFLFTYLCVL